MVLLIIVAALTGLISCAPDRAPLPDASTDAFEAELEPLRNFVLPGGHPGAAWLQLARTVARRAERRVVALARVEPLPETAVRYLNRLSDLLFVIARVLSGVESGQEVLWNRERC